MTRDDSADFVWFLTERLSAEFVPERSADPPPFPRYSTLVDVQAWTDRDVRYHRFAVLSPRWEQLPLSFDEVHANDGQHFFTVSMEYGGPAFDLILSRTWSENGHRWIVQGSFSDRPYDIVDKAFLADRSQYRTFERPVAMKTAHKEVRVSLRRNGCPSVRQKMGHPGPWIMPGALREFQAGTSLGFGGLFEPKARISKSRRTSSAT
jgi:hypothetical protein